MKIAELLLAELDVEAQVTRPFIERVPDNLESWKPHDKSMTLGSLATHLVNVPSWAVEAVGRSELDVVPPEGFKPAPYPGAKALLDTFDQNVEKGKAALASATNEHLQAPWRLLAGGQTIWELPRYVVLSRSVINHLVHHRAQLGVYFRLNGIPVPGSYGPSADDDGRGGK